MAGEIKVLQFSEGTTVTAPTPSELAVADATSTGNAVNLGQLNKSVYCVASITAARALTASERKDCSILGVQGNDAIYIFDAAETTADDGDLYLTPDDITEPAAGRWVKSSGAAGGTPTDYLENSFNDRVIPAKDNFEGAGNTSLTDNANTNPRGLSFADLKHISGEEKIEMYRIEKTGEKDSDGKPEWKIVSPKEDNRVRLYGQWEHVVDTTNSYYVQSSVETDYILVSGVYDSIGVMISQDPTNQPNDVDFLVDGSDTGTNISFRHPHPLAGIGVKTMAIASDSSLKGLGLDLHTTKIINNSSDSNFIIKVNGIVLVGDNVANGDEVAGNMFVGKQAVSFAESLAVSGPTANSAAFDKGGTLVRYVDKADNTKKWSERFVPTTETTATTISSATNSFAVADATGFEIGDIILLKDSSSSEKLRITNIVSNTLTTDTNTMHAYTNADVVVWAKTFLSSSIARDDEEVSNIRHFREFSSGSTGNDMSALPTSGSNSRTFVKDDGSSVLHARGAFSVAATTIKPEGIRLNADGDSIMYSWYGTGIALELYDSASGGADTFTYFVDDIDAGELNTAGNTDLRIVDIMSNLPMGQHTLTLIQVSGATFSPVITRFIEYVGKKPDIFNEGPSQTQQSGNILAIKQRPAEYLFEITPGRDDMSTGVFYQSFGRHAVFSNGSGGTTDWSFTFSISTTAFGHEFYTDRSGASINRWFFGTGFELVYLAGTGGDCQLAVDGSNLTTGNFGSATFTESTGLTNFVTGTGVLTPGSSGSGAGKLSVVGLSATPEWHLLTITTSSSGTTRTFYGMMIIGAPGFTNLLETSQGNIAAQALGQSIIDTRRFNAVESLELVPESSQANGFLTSVSTTSASYVPIPDMRLEVFSDGREWLLIFCAPLENSAGNFNYYKFYVDGSGTGFAEYSDIHESGGSSELITTLEKTYLPKGTHTVQMMWRTGGATASSDGVKDRRLIAIPLAKASK